MIPPTPRALLGLTLLLSGCGGPRPETLLYELRIVAAVAEPPEVAQGEPYDLTAIIADPTGEGGDWMIWGCLPDLGCAVERGELGIDEPTATVVAVAPAPVWVMACAPGACDLSAATDAQLEDPQAWLQDLPVSGVTLGSRLTRITEAPVEEHVDTQELAVPKREDFAAAEETQDEASQYSSADDEDEEADPDNIGGSRWQRTNVLSNAKVCC